MWIPLSKVLESVVTTKISIKSGEFFSPSMLKNLLKGLMTTLWKDFFLN